MPAVLLLRLTVRAPVPGVRLAVQETGRGSEALIPPAVVTAAAATFEVSADVTPDRDGVLALRGAVVQGPRGGRFLYVNAGVSAGQVDSPWTRRAKVPLLGVTPALIEAALAAPGAVLEGAIAGTARDGGPACASVPLLGDGWQLRPAHD